MRDCAAPRGKCWQMELREVPGMESVFLPAAWSWSILGLGRMQGMNCMGFFTPCHNSFCFQGTLLLDMGLGAP